MAVILTVCIVIVKVAKTEKVIGYRLSVIGMSQKPKTNNQELATSEWKQILDEIHTEGCLYLTLSGGDPLIREDFLEIYAYAKSKGFLIDIFTNGQLLTKKIIDYFVKSPPASIEITLNGITETTYESITQVPGSFKQAILLTV